MGNTAIGLEVHFILVCALRIFLSFCAGLILGLERKHRQQVLGIRTLILISESATLLGILSTFIVKAAGAGDAARIAAQVVSGCGFLGGGAIMKTGLNIKGLTSAAIIWTAAATGLSLGSGLYIPAILCVLVAVISLVGIEKFEQKYFPAERSKCLRLTFDVQPGAHIDTAELKSAIERNGFTVSDMNMSRIIASNMMIFHYSVKSPKKDDFSALIDELSKIGALSEFSITD
ncbi:MULTISPECIES: MgtC/SapB family protein [Treponema]|uniref:MgtC/SapB transporter n=1 Tax=Treponema saccharophilum DSM 2985 TaxID=907348 RepID=H7EMV5_9SPIR|nr:MULTISPECIES: MgtC/SapB family protein [Treponema]EIC01019.1 MgtC/SapB transporter [Treponema saccharophilum DSM 2985]BDC95331.1 methyltransferase [Treponema saccharophilum]